MSAPQHVGYEILRAIRRILRKVSEHSRTLSRTAGLTVPQLLCMRAIGDLASQEGCVVTVVDVADRVHLAAPTVSRILDRLDQAGFVHRERSATDRRKVLLTLTRLGEERLKSLPQPLHEQFLVRVEALEPARRLELLEALDTIVEMMEASDIEASPLLTPDLDVKRQMPGE